MFGHEGTAVINAMRDIIIVVFERIEIASNMDLDIRIKYTERIMRGPVLNKFRQSLLECKE